MEIIRIESADSTNNWLATRENCLPPSALVYCHTQTAGRGQRGNSWESEPGKNITASIIFHPQDFPAASQFAISEAVAIAIVDFLANLGVDAKIKWPNDIYVGDRKICGILVEHVVTGRNISRTIAGFGINLNQKEFLSDAPNPVSLCQLTERVYDVDECVASLAALLEESLLRICEPESLHNRFLNLLWRNDGSFHGFFDRKENRRIEAKILGVAPSGVLWLLLSDGSVKEYAFKEIEFMLKEM